MIAMSSPLPIAYDPFSTFLSAVVAIVATWLTFGYEFIQLFLYRRRLLERHRARASARKIKKEEREEVRMKRREAERRGRGRGRAEGRTAQGEEEERRGLMGPGSGPSSGHDRGADELDAHPAGSTSAPIPTINVTLDPTADLQDDDDEEEETGGEDDVHAKENENENEPAERHQMLAPKNFKFKAPSGWNGEETSGMVSPRSVGPDPMIRSDSLASSSSPDRNVHRRAWTGFNPSDEDLSRTRGSIPRPGSGKSRQGSGPSVATEYDISPHDYAPQPQNNSNYDDDQDRNQDRSYSHRSESLTTTFSNTSTESLPSLSSSRDYRYSNTENGSRSMSITSRASTGNSIANDPTISTAAVQAYAGGAMSLRMRELAHSKPRSVSLMWREIFEDLKSGVNRKVLIKGTLLGSSAFCMHYEGMRSMRLGHGIVGLKGGVEWSWTWVGISWVIACAASIVAVVFSAFESWVQVTSDRQKIDGRFLFDDSALVQDGLSPTSHFRSDQLGRDRSDALERHVRRHLLRRCRTRLSWTFPPRRLPAHHRHCLLARLGHSTRPSHLGHPRRLHHLHVVLRLARTIRHAEQGRAGCRHTYQTDLVAGHGRTRGRRQGGQAKDRIHRCRLARDQGQFWCTSRCQCEMFS